MNSPLHQAVSLILRQLEAQGADYSRARIWLTPELWEAERAHRHSLYTIEFGRTGARYLGFPVTVMRLQQPRVTLPDGRAFPIRIQAQPLDRQGQRA